MTDVRMPLRQPAHIVALEVSGSGQCVESGHRRRLGALPGQIERRALGRRDRQQATVDLFLEQSVVARDNPLWGAVIRPVQLDHRVVVDPLGAPQRRRSKT